MRRPQSVNPDGSPNYASSHLVEFDYSKMPFDVGLLGAIGDGFVVAIGTAFFIGDEFAVTAWHVIEQLIEQIQPGGNQAFTDRLRRNPDIRAELGFNLEIHIHTANEPSLFAQVTYISKSPVADIALLKVSADRQQSSGRGRVPLLHIAPPPIGSAIDAFGVIADQPELDYSENHKAAFSCTFWWSHGVMKQHLWRGRGSNMPFPVFETTASFPGGMSGGPVVAMSGWVFGIVCYDLGPYLDDPNAEPISYVCSLLPLVCCRCWHDFQDGRGQIHTTVKELTDRGVIRLEGLDRVELAWEGDEVIGLNLRPA